jgi:hypothetical protein
MMNNHFFRAYLFIFLTLFIYSCANVVAPSGGPKDEDPPRVLRSTPANQSIRYQGDDVRIFFDEFVTLKNLNQNLLVSPPLPSQPEVRVRGRSIIMSVNDTLAENTTYVFFFGESIVDITEGNPIPNFRYVVSTGDFVDSLSVRGTVRNALTLEPEAGVFVMLYDNVYDSVPMKERPLYVSKTDANGRFTITNMRMSEYLMFALRDMNANFLYDNPDETIAFIDSLIRPEYAATVVFEEEPTDNDETEEFSETEEGNVSSDTISQARRRPLENDLVSYNMFLFKEKDTHQRILSASLIQRGKVNLAFRIPTDSVSIRDYRNPFDYDWYIPEYNPNRDTLTLWMPDMQRDSLFLEITDRGKVDSLRLSMIPRQPRTTGRRAATTADTIQPTTNLRASNLRTGNLLPYFQQPVIISETPLQSIDTENILLLMSDTIELVPEFRFTDNISRRLELTNNLENNGNYRLIFNKNSVYDIFGHTNDSVAFRFRTDNPENYGTILVNISLPQPNEQYILQLLNQKLELVSEKVISASNIYAFQHLNAGTYRLRLIHDENRNYKWDTGNYLQKIQPEPVFLLTEPIQARINWEIETIWIVQQE